MRPTRLLTGLASVALLVVGLVALLPDCASACTCALFPGSQQEQAERALNHSTAVFSGEVVEVEKPPPPTTMKMAMQSEATVTLRVSEVWKGPEQETLEVSTPSQESACGYSFKEEKEYLVYAYGKEEPFKTDLCTGTKPLSEASADLEALGNGATVGDGGDTLSDTSGGFPRLDIVGMLGLAVAAVSLVVLLRLVRTS